MPENGVDLSQVQETSQHEQQQLPTVDTPPIPAPSTAAKPEQHQPEQTEDADLIRAKLGVERFKAAYDAGDEEWKRFVMSGFTGEQVQAMYLGLRPVCEVEANYPHFSRTRVEELLRKRAGEDYGSYGRFIDNRERAERVLEQYPKYFPDYIPGETFVSSYIMRVFANKGKIPSLQHIQQGLLFGYPLHAVEQYAQYSDATRPLTEALHATEDLPPEDEMVLLGMEGYQKTTNEGPTVFVSRHSGSYEQAENVDEHQTNINNYTAGHQTEISALLDRRYPNMDDGVKQYILTLRFVHLPGFVYYSGNPAPEDRAFEQKVRDTFEQSGMNEFVASVKAEQKGLP